MSCSLPARGTRFFALMALAGTTAVTGTLVAASPATAAPVAIEEYLTTVPGNTPPTGPESYFTPVRLGNGDTAYGVNEHQPLAPVGEQLLDDEDYAVAEPFGDLAEDRQQPVGEKVGNHAVYWEAGNAALAGYILSVFGATADADEAQAVHWAVRSLSTAPAPPPELSGVEQSHRARAESMVQNARDHIASFSPQEGYRADVVVGDTGRPTALSVQLPEAYDGTTVTLEGPATFADGTTTATFTGGPRGKTLELAVAEDITEGQLTATLTATMPSTDLVILADDDHRDLLIAGQRRTVTWSAGVSFVVVEPEEPGAVDPDEGEGAPEKGKDAGVQEIAADDSEGANTPAEGSNGELAAVDEAADVDESADQGAATTQDATGGGEGVTNDTEEQTTVVMETFALFQEETETRTQVVTETTNTTSGTGIIAGVGGGAAYADSVMADTGMGAARATNSHSRVAPMILALIAVAAGLGSWALRRWKPADVQKDAAVG